MPELSVVVPAYNESEGIGPTLNELGRALDGLDAEILVVDDGSEDDTAEKARAAGARVLRHERNLGYGAALKTGIRHSQAPILCITDADGTYPNERIPELFAAMQDADMVVGARTGENVAIPVLRRPAKLVIRWLAEILTGRSIPDLNSGLRLFRRDVVERYMDFLPKGFSFTTTLTMAMLFEDYLVRFVPIDYHPRTGHSKIRPIRDTLGFLLLLLRVTVYFQPLKIFLPATLVLLSAAIGTFSVDVGRATGLSDKTVILTLFAGTTFLVGLLADSVAKR